MRHVCSLFVVALVFSGCATVVEGHEKALYYSAGKGMSAEPFPSGWYWHLPWNDYVKYDLRWTSHEEKIHIHSKDGLHMDISVVAVVRPDPNQLYQLHLDAGPSFYEMLVRPALFAATRDASARFNHLEIATQTHAVEEAIRGSLQEHLAGQHLELSEVAIQHFDLPQEVEAAANRKAASAMLLAAKDVDFHLAESDAKIDQARKRGIVESAGVERHLRAEQDLEQAALDLQIEETRRKAERVKVEAEVDAVKLRAEGDAQATRLRAEADKVKIAAESQNVSNNYVKLQALAALKEAVAGSNTRLYVMPVGKNGLPSYFNPFLNPYGDAMTEVTGQDDKPTRP
jgi:regulator of protease activity HflC (stomatin/prohibitin superfamily)